MKNITKISVWLDTSEANADETETKVILANVKIVLVRGLAWRGIGVLDVEYEGDYDSQEEGDPDPKETRRLRAYGQKQAGNILRRREK